MPLPLMPGSEPIIEAVKPPEPQVGRDNYPRSTPNGGVGGCSCLACQRMREEYEQQNRTPPVPSFAEYYASPGAIAQAVQPREAQLNWASVLPRGVPAGAVRGRYDFTQGPNPYEGLSGAVRWREPGTMEVYDEAGISQWTFTEELPGGVTP